MRLSLIIRLYRYYSTSIILELLRCKLVYLIRSNSISFCIKVSMSLPSTFSPFFSKSCSSQEESLQPFYCLSPLEEGLRKDLLRSYDNWDEDVWRSEALSSSTISECIVFQVCPVAILSPRQSLMLLFCYSSTFPSAAVSINSSSFSPSIHNSQPTSAMQFWYNLSKSLCLRMTAMISLSKSSENPIPRVSTAKSRTFLARAGVSSWKNQYVIARTSPATEFVLPSGARKYSSQQRHSCQRR